MAVRTAPRALGVSKACRLHEELNDAAISKRRRFAANCKVGSTLIKTRRSMLQSLAPRTRRERLHRLGSTSLNTCCIPGCMSVPMS